MHALVKQYLENLGETVTFETFSLQDDHDGNGIYISQWNSAHPKPTPDQLEALRPEVEASVISESIRTARKNAYPAIGDQLDVLWKVLNKLQTDGTNLGVNGTNMLNTIQDVKMTYPKQ